MKLLWTVLYFIEQKFKEVIKPILSILAILGGLIFYVRYPVIAFYCLVTPLLVLHLLLGGICVIVLSLAIRDWLKDNWIMAKERATERVKP